VDPFLGEGIYYAIKTATAAAATISECVRTGTGDLSAYQRWLESTVYPEFRQAEKIGDLVYNHPRLWYSILEREPDIMRRYYNVIRGEEGTGNFYEWIMSRIRSKPWRVLRRWVASHFVRT